MPGPMRVAVALVAAACLVVQARGNKPATDGTPPLSDIEQQPKRTLLTVSEAVLEVLGGNLDYVADMRAATEAVDAAFDEAFTTPGVFDIFSRNPGLTKWQETVLEMKSQSSQWMQVVLSEIGHRKLAEGKTDEAVAHFQSAMRRAKHADSLERLHSGALDIEEVPWHMETPSYKQMVNLILGQSYMKEFVQARAPKEKRGNNNGGGGDGAAAQRGWEGGGNQLDDDDDEFTHHEIRQADAIASARGELSVSGIGLKSAEVTANLYSGGYSPEALEVDESGFVLHGYQRQLLRDLPPISPHCPPPDRVNANITAKELYEKYIYLNRPFIIKAGSVDHWPALNRWTREGLYTHYGDVELNVATKPLPSNPISRDDPPWKGSPEVETMNMEEYLDKVMPSQLVPLEHGNVTHPDRRYVFNTVSGRMADDLTDPEHLSYAQSKNFFNKEHGHPKGYLEWTIGPALSGSHMHAHLAAWNVVVSGRKRWMMAPYGEFKPPEDTRPAYHWFTEQLPLLQAETTCRLMEFEQAAGELVYVPDHWYHAIINLEPTVGASKQLGGSMWPDALPDAVFGN